MSKLDKEKSSTYQTIQTVRQTLQEIELLQKTIDKQPKGASSTTAIALVRQKKALTKLLRMANDGSAIAGVGYVKACCISGQNVDYIFNYRNGYADKSKESYVKALFEPKRLIPFLLKQNVLNKVRSITSFAMDLPSLTDKPFSPALCDALQCQNRRGETFGSQLADKLHQIYNRVTVASNSVERQSLEQLIKLLAERGYAPVQNLYGAILYKSNRPEEARQAYQSVLLNKYATSSDIQQARMAMRLRKSLIFIRPSRSSAINE